MKQHKQITSEQMKVEFKTPRTLKDIKNLPFVRSVHREHDGAFGDDDNPQGNYWVYLKEGYVSDYMECGTIHEPTVKSICEIFNEGISTNNHKPVAFHFNTNK